MKNQLGWLCLFFASLSLCRAEVDWPQLQFSLVASNLDSPVHVAHANDGSGHLYIVEQPGAIRIWNGTNLESIPFLDIRNKVDTTSGERGLLSMAFPPGYSTNRHFYVFYTRQPDGAVTLSRFSLLPGEKLADAKSEQVLLNISHPIIIHNGGQMVFGPDGYLYLGIGDGGYGNVSTNPAQRLDSLLGKVLRIDPERGNPYAIPPNNPFITDASARPEIWAYGLRNPWRFSFDRQSGDLYIADVGDLDQEEINFQPAGSAGGHNYGWPIYQGNVFYNTNFPAVPTNSLSFPVAAYSNPSDSCIIGGYVCRATNSSRLNDIYFYGDFMEHRIYAMKFDEGEWKTVLLAAHPAMSAFGEDEAGNLYVLDIGGGKLSLIQDNGVAAAPTFSPPPGNSPTKLITLNSLTPNSTIRYTTENRDPIESDPGLSPGGSIVISNGTSLHAQTFRADLIPSVVAVGTFKLVVGTPQFNDIPSSTSSTTVLNNTLLTIASATPEATIYYTIDGTTPTTNSAVYLNPLTINGGLVLKAFAVANGYINSGVRTVNFSLVKTAAPFFSPFPSSGPLTNGTTIEISCMDSNAIIRYTLDGSDPDTNSTIYSNPLVFSNPITVKARSFAPDHAPSDVVAVFYGLLVMEKTVVTTFAGGSSAGFSNGFGISARFFAPVGICRDAAGNFFVGDRGNNVVRKITASGEVTTYAGSGIAGSQLGAATSAQFREPTGVCVDQGQNVYVADERNCNRICKIDTNGIVTLFANLSGCSIGTRLWTLEADPAGNVYTGARSTLRKITGEGIISVVAGTGVEGWGSQVGVGIDASTNLYAATANSLWKIAPDGVAEALVSGGGGFSDGPRLLSQFLSPQDVVVDSFTNILITDRNRVRKIDASGKVSTLAGSGIAGYKDGLGSQAQFNGVTGLCVDTNGNIYVADTGNHRIRRISADVDSDQIPDFEETAGSGFDPAIDDRNADSDGDGVSNADEYIAGTNPVSSTSRFQIKSVNRSGNDLNISWNAAANRIYEISSSTNLLNWNVVTNIPIGLAGETSFVLTNGAGSPSQSFYRLRVSLP